MAYVPLDLKASDDAVNAAIAMFTEDYLTQAHYLLSGVFGRDSLSEHFGLSAAVMTLLAIASASSIRHFDPATGKKKIGDGEAFKGFLGDYFPWDCLGIEDDQHRNANDGQKAAIKELYASIRNPLIHSAGVVATGGRSVQIRHVFPGLSDAENEHGVEAMCRRATLDGQSVIELRGAKTVVHTRELYWGARKAIERLSADRGAEVVIGRNLIRNSP